MSDLTIHTGWWCKSNEDFHLKMLSSNGKTEYIVAWGPTYDYDFPNQYGWHCTCPAFMFRTNKRGERTCKHIVAAEAKRCAWNAEMTPGMTPDPGNKCPSCDGEVVAFSVGA